MKRFRIGIIGCGRISDIYLKNFTQEFNEIIEIAAVSDMVQENAIEKAKEYGIGKIYSSDELISAPDIDIVVNLTNPSAHYEINKKALESGKHVYCEKPLAVTREEGNKLVETAKAKGLLICSAPDTFLGGGLQTCRKLLDDGWIGKPVAASGTIVMGSPAEGMHPNIEAFLKAGGGPMFDMGPYYVTALVALLGPVSMVTGVAHTLIPDRKFTNKKSSRYGQTVKIDTPMTTCGVLHFKSGVAATLITTKECFGYTPHLEIYGTEGILYVNDPNNFGGPVFVQKRGGEKMEIPLTHGYSENSRGLGVAEMAYSLISGRQPRVSSELSFHVLDIMQSFYDSSSLGAHVDITSSSERPEPFLPGLLGNRLE